MRARPARSALTVAAVALGVALVVAITSTHQTLRLTLFDWIKRWTGPADLSVNVEDAVRDPAGPLEAIANLPGVSAVGPRLFLAYNPIKVKSAVDDKAAPTDVVIMGLAAGDGPRPFPPANRIPPLKIGRVFEPGETDVVLLDEVTAAALKVKVGDEVVFPTEWAGTALERPTRKARLIGLLEGGAAEPADQTPGVPAPSAGARPGRAVAPLTLVQTLLAEPGLANGYDVAFALGLPEAQRRGVTAEIARRTPRPGEVLARPAGKPRGEFLSDKLDLLIRFSPSPRNMNAVVASLRTRPGVVGVRSRLTQYPLKIAAAGGSATPAERVRIIGLSEPPVSGTPVVPAMAEGRWFAPGERGVLLLSAGAARRLAARPGDTVSLPAMWSGTPYARPALTATLIGTLADEPEGVGGGERRVPIAAAPLADVQDWTREPGLIDEFDVALSDDLGLAAADVTAARLADEAGRLVGERGRSVPRGFTEMLVYFGANGRPAGDVNRAAAEISALPGIADAAADIQYNAWAASNQRLKWQPITLIGITEKSAPPKLVQGRFPAADEADVALVDEATAALLAIQPDDRLLLPAVASDPTKRQRTVHVVGIVANRAPSLTWAHPNAVYAPLATAQRLLESEGILDILHVSFAADASDARREELGRKVRDIAGKGATVYNRPTRVVANVAAAARTEKMLWEVRDLPGVAAVGPRLFLLSQFLRVSSTARHDPLPVQAMGVEAENQSDVMSISDRVPPLLAGRVFAPGERGVLLLDSRTADALKVAPGDTVVLPATQSGGKVERPATTAKLIGVFAPALITDAKNLGAAVAPLPDVQEWMREPDLINRVDIALSPDLSPERRAELPEEVSLVVGDRGRVQSWATRQEYIERNLGLVKLLIQVVSMAALLCSVFIVLNTLNINLLERTRQIGMLRCLGLTRGQTAAAVFFESFVVGVAGLALGIPFGLLVWAGVLSLFSAELAVASVSWEGIVLAGVGGLLAVLTAAVWPAVRAVRVTPMAAVRATGEDGGRGAAGVWSWIAGAALLAGEVAITLGLEDPGAKLYFHLFLGLPLIFAGYFLVSPLVVRLAGPPLSRGIWLVMRLLGGVPRQLVDNSIRQQRRSIALAACALMVGGGLVTAISINSNSLIETWTKRLPDKLPEVYAIGPGSYAEDLAYRFYLANREKVDRVRRNESFDEPELDLDELVRYPNVEKSWAPFFREWRSLNGQSAAAAPGTVPPGLTEMYIQDVELTRPIHSELEGYVPKDAAMVAVDPDPEHGFFAQVPVKFIRGDPATAYRKLAEGGAALVPKSLYASRQVDVGHKFTVNLDPSSPEKTKTFEVVGVVELGVLEVMFMYLDPMAGPDSLTASVFLVGKIDAVAKVDPRGLRDKRYFYKSNAALVSQKIVMGRFADGVDTKAAMPALKAAGKNLVVDSVTELLVSLREEFSRIVELVRSIGWVTLAIAGLGVANVMFMKILRQRRQIGVLRALGLTRIQSAALVLLEAAVVGLIGGLLGAALGVHLSLVSKHLDRAIFGVEYDIHFPTGYVLATLGVSAAVCIAASLLPARKAARMKIVDALARTA